MGKELVLKPIQGEGSGLVTIYGKVTGSGSADTATISGKGFVSIAASSGVYTITIDASYDADNLVGISMHVAANTPANVDTYEFALDDDGTTNQTVLVTCSEGGTPTQLDANEFLYISLTFEDSNYVIQRPRS